MGAVEIGGIRAGAVRAEQDTALHCRILRNTNPIRLREATRLLADAIVENLRQAADVGEQRAQLGCQVRGLVGVVADLVVVDVYPARGAVVVDVVGGAPADIVVHDGDGRGLVVLDNVVEHLDIGEGHDQHAGTGGYHADDAARRREVGGIVVAHDVVVNLGAGSLPGQVGQVEYQDAASVIYRFVVVDLGVGGILDLDTGHVQ